MSTMSEYKRQIVVGVFVAAVIALVLAGGAIYLLPMQPTQTTTTTFPTSTTTATATASMTSTATSTATATTTQSTSSGTTSTTSITTIGTTTPITITTTATTSGSTTMTTGPTVTVTVTEIVGTATVTVTTTQTQGLTTTVTTTTTVTSIGRLEITNAYANSPSQVVVSVKNSGSTDQTITDILINGKPLSSVNGGTSNPSLPIKVAAGTSQTINLNFSSPLSSNTIYFVAIQTSSS